MLFYVTFLLSFSHLIVTLKKYNIEIDKDQNEFLKSILSR